MEDSARGETFGEKSRVASLDQLWREPRNRNRAEPHSPAQAELIAGEGGRPEPATHDLEPLRGVVRPRKASGPDRHPRSEPPTLLLQPGDQFAAVSRVDVFARSIGQAQLPFRPSARRLTAPEP